MKIIKPAWLTHDEGSAIYSVDIHPQDLKFVTGGQNGNKGGLFIIWNLKSVLDEETRLHTHTPRMLCRIDQAACINCVRWSKSGRFLAAAGDDQTVTIWQYYGRTKSAGTFGSTKPTNVEHWKCVNTLSGHTGDVLHVEWSPTDEFLASGSVDNRIIIWNSAKFPEKITVLNGHSDMVKGLTWDPICRYLATQSCDKTVKIWATATWECVKTVKDPFCESSNTTQVLRLDWGRDGQWLVTAHAMNNGGPTAQVIERTGWKFEKDLVGHRKAVTCVRWSPILCQKTLKKQKKPCVVGCFALGSRDRGISVWQPCYPRPVTVAHHLFSAGVADLAWSSDGVCLMGCSSDGGLVVFHFQPDELGRRLTDRETDEHLKSMYGKAPKRLNSTGSFQAMNGQDESLHFVDNPLVLKAQQEYRKRQRLSPNNSIMGSPPMKRLESGASGGRNNDGGKANADENARPAGEQRAVTPQKEEIGIEDMPSNTKQEETKTKDGRRRIKPMFLGSTIELAPETPMGGFGLNTEVNMNLPDIGAFSTDNSNIAASTPCQPSTSRAKPVIGTAPNLESIGGTQKSPKKNGNATSTSFSGTTLKRKAVTPKEGKESKKTKKHHHHYKLPEEETSAEEREEPESRKASPVGRERLSEQPRATAGASVSREGQYGSRGVALAVPEKRNVLTLNFEMEGKGENEFTVTARNEGISGLPLTKIQCSKREELIWESVCSSNVLAIAATCHVISVCCADRSIRVLSSVSGVSLSCPLVVDGCGSVMAGNGWHLLVITSAGTCYVWDWKEKVAIISGEPLGEILSGDGEVCSVESGSLTSEGVPILSLSNGKTFSYSKMLKAWTLLSDESDTIRKLSRVQPITDAQKKLDSFGPLASLTKDGPRVGGNLSQKCPKTTQAMATCALLESRIQAALALQSPLEYKFWLHQYVSHLVREGSRIKLKELTEELLGPVHRRETGEAQGEILGLKKRDILRELMPVISSNPLLQRLYMEIHGELERRNEIL